MDYKIGKRKFMSFLTWFVLRAPDSVANKWMSGLITMASINSSRLDTPRAALVKRKQRQHTEERTGLEVKSLQFMAIIAKYAQSAPLMISGQYKKLFSDIQNDASSISCPYSSRGL